jgi:membrane protein YqaA with SNARE-associated domain
MLRPPVVKPITPETGPAWMRSRYSVWALAGISFAESVFAPILIDPFLIGLIVGDRKRWKVYVTTAIVASILGGIFAYYLGLLFFDTFGQALITAYGVEEKFASISADVNENGFVFVLIGAFTPIPYKLVALASGILQVSIFTFIIASVFGRILRLGLVGIAAYALSPKMLPIMQRNHYMVALIMGGVLISYIGLKLFV